MRVAFAYGNRLAVGLLLILVSNPANGKTQASPQPPSGELGSTLTLEDLKQKPKQIAEKRDVPLEVHAAAEPVPALKYRFTPSMRELKPGSALLHFSRAMLMLNHLPRDLRSKVDTSPGEPTPSPEDVQALLTAAAPMFAELHELALSEDFQWDHRLRDVRGSAVWAYLLPDVQEGRSLARMLRLRIDSQLSRNDIDGAMASISEGYRLAEFMANGETLVQQLVALAIQEMMRSSVEVMITKPECPNLYWALAGIPSHSQQMQRAIEFEVSSFDSVFEMLAEAETGVGDEAYWQTRLQDLMTSLRELSNTGNELPFSVTVAAMTASPLAKQKLIEAGWKKEEVEAMPATRALLINTRRELRNWSHEMEKSTLLPYALSADIGEAVMREFEKQTHARRQSSLGAVIAALIFPSTAHARAAVVRSQYLHHRLMAVEALRMHAATHNGQLPKDLQNLSPVPAPLNPFNNQPFHYKAEVVDGGVRVELSGELTPQYKSYQRLNVIFKDTTLAR